MTEEAFEWCGGAMTRKGKVVFKSYKLKKLGGSTCIKS
jgi:hypothetical protein